MADYLAKIVVEIPMTQEPYLGVTKITVTTNNQDWMYYESYHVWNKDHGRLIQFEEEGAFVTLALS